MTMSSNYPCTNHYINLAYRNETSIVRLEFYLDFAEYPDLFPPLETLNRKILEQSQRGRLEEVKFVAPGKDTFTLHLDPKFHEPNFQRELYQFYGLMMALMNGNLRLAKKYLDAGVRPCGPNNMQCVAPLLFAMISSPEAVRLLLEYGALENCWRYRIIFPTNFLILTPNSVLDVFIEAAEDQMLKLEEYKSIKKSFFKDPPEPPLTEFRAQVFKKLDHIKSLVTQPLSLFLSSRRVIVRSLGSMPDRRPKVQKLPVPDLVKRNLCLDDLDLKFVHHDPIVTMNMFDSLTVLSSKRFVEPKIEFKI